MKKLGGVKKAFDEALEGPPPANTGLQPPREGEVVSGYAVIQAQTIVDHVNLAGSAICL
jgi:hypothetical protein